MTQPKSVTRGQVRISVQLAYDFCTTTFNCDPSDLADRKDGPTATQTAETGKTVLIGLKLPQK
jgi:hypothetical protein